MTWFPLPIFPEGSLASSVVTTVWVGVLVFCVMNLRFGWPFSGLVVPGYLVPLMIVKPWSAGVIIVEAIVTFLVSRWLIEGLPKVGLGCRPFGRDRFMVMIIVSALVRLVFDAWLLPSLGAWASSAWGWNLDYRNNLQSIGLIVICLTANQLWKTGIRRGAMSFVCNLAITYVIIRFVLMEFTNFSVSRLGFLYEDVAASIFASPKAYVILITSALLASRANLRYGWDFHGVLIPALLALQWYEPLKILTSFLEAGVVLGLGTLALRAPGLRGITVEGARKMLLFFTISFLYKMTIGFGVGALWPEMKVSDCYGFGYLVPTLIALKMHQLGRVVHQIGITLQISLLSVGAANAVGLLLLSLPFGIGEPAPPSSSAVARRGGVLETVLHAHFVRAHDGSELPARRPLSEEEEYCFDQGIVAMLEAAESGHVELLGRAAELLGRAGFGLEEVSDRHLVVADLRSTAGFAGHFVLDRRPSSHLVVGVPHPREDLGAFDASVVLFRHLGARAFAVGGVDREESGSSAPPTRRSSSATMASTFHGLFLRRVEEAGVLNIRAAEGAELRVSGGVPQGLDVAVLERLCGPLKVRWTEDLAEGRRHRSSGSPGPDASAELSIDPLVLSGSAWPAPAERLVSGSLAGYLLREAVPPSPDGSDDYRPPAPAELLHLDRQLLGPLFRTTTSDLDRRLPLLAQVAHTSGFSLRLLSHEGARYVHLHEPPETGRHWGGFVLRIPDVGESGPAIGFQVPSRSDDGSLLGFAAAQFERLGARLLLISATSGATNRDGSTLLTVPANRDSFFNLAHQSFLRHSSDRPAAVVQCRAFSPTPDTGHPAADLLWAVSDRAMPRAEADALLRPVRGLLGDDGVEILEVEDTIELAPFALGGNAQAVYLDLAGRAAFAVAWLTPEFRSLFRGPDAVAERMKVLRALGIAIDHRPLASVMGERPIGRLDDDRIESLKAEIRSFRITGDILRLQSILASHPDTEFRGVLDPDNGQLYLLVSDATAEVTVLVGNLARSAPERAHRADDAAGVETFRRSRAAWLHLDPI